MTLEVNRDQKDHLQECCIWGAQWGKAFRQVQLISLHALQPNVTLIDCKPFLLV